MIVDQRGLAILETSFWSAAYKAEVVASMLDYFRVYVPSEVQREIEGPQTTVGWERPHQGLFRRLREQMFTPEGPEPEPASYPQIGEASAMALAQHMQSLFQPESIILLCNDKGASDYARNLKLKVLTVPSFIVRLCEVRMIPPYAAIAKLQAIEHITNTKYITTAIDLVNELPNPEQFISPGK